MEHIREEAAEIPDEVAASPIGRRAVAAYLWLMDKAPTSTRGRIIFVVCIFLIVLAPSLALLYVSLAAGQEATESWFGKLGYFGVFLANLGSTATVFVPVPALTAAAQALIVSSSRTLSPVGVGVAGGLGMAIGEITAYIGGMAASYIAREEEIKAPGRLQPLINAVTKRVGWLMDHYGMLTLYTLSAVPNVFFEVAGLTAGATRYSFPRFMFAVVAGKITRGLLLAYIGEKLIFG
jgi:membrane protein DedA with SNARE-associated domain